MSRSATSTSAAPYRRSHVFLAALLGVGAVVWCARAASELVTTRQTMHQVFEAVAVLVPVAFAASDDPWTAQAEPVRRSLAVLGTAAEQLATHGAERETSFRFLSRSLATQARMVEWEVDRRNYPSAAYYTQRLVETCVACHVRLPSASDHDFAGTLLARVDPRALDPYTKATLETAGRKFDAALATYEALFADPDQMASSDEFVEAIASYFIVALRVQRAPDRAARGLDVLARRKDSAEQLGLNLKLWRQALRDLAPALHGPVSRERAREILDSGQSLSEFPFDAAEWVHATVAASILFRYIDEKRPEGEDLAEALYLLARTESFTRRSFTKSESSTYLEQAIRVAPHTAVAERAYARLERQTLLQYEGLRGAELPQKVEAWLRDLREQSSRKPLDRPDSTAALPRAQVGA